jgi:hypothetical protein
LVVGTTEATGVHDHWVPLPSPAWRSSVLFSIAQMTHRAGRDEVHQQLSNMPLPPAMNTRRKA